MVTTLLAAQLFDGTGSPAIDDAFLRIGNGSITAVGRREDLGSTVEGARDLGDVTLQARLEQGDLRGHSSDARAGHVELLAPGACLEPRDRLARRLNKRLRPA